MQDDGFEIADSQRSMTVFQKRVYLTAKAYHSEKEREQAQSNSDNPTPSTNTSKYL